MNELLIYIGGATVLLWGIAHLFPTRNVVKGFGEISDDNKHIITMEWIVEGIALIFLGLMVMAVTSRDPTSEISALVYWLSFLQLVVLAIVSLFTGFKVHFFMFKLCPFIFMTSAILILLGAFVI